LTPTACIGDGDGQRHETTKTEKKGGSKNKTSASNASFVLLVVEVSVDYRYNTYQQTLEKHHRSSILSVLWFGTNFFSFPISIAPASWAIKIILAIAIALAEWF
jgi:hypothetical protein